MICSPGPGVSPKGRPKPAWTSCGRPNHWRLAVDYHEENHPGTDHACQDLLQVDWRDVPDHDLLLSSPACQGNSSAAWPSRGRSNVAKKHDADRNTAWAVTGCADALRPRTIIVENTRHFLDWPMYPAWKLALELVGYVVTEHLFDVADFGVPQNRTRVIVTARQGEALVIENPKIDHRPFGPCVDWEAGPWFDLASKPKGVRKRVEAARARGCGDRFLSHYVTGHRGRELWKPIRTITTKNQWAVVDGDQIRMLNSRELAAGMAFPDGYRLPSKKEDALRMLGNAIPPTFARELVRQAVA